MKVCNTWRCVRSVLESCEGCANVSVMCVNVRVCNMWRCVSVMCGGVLGVNAKIQSCGPTKLRCGHINKQLSITLVCFDKTMPVCVCMHFKIQTKVHTYTAVSNIGIR